MNQEPDGPYVYQPHPVVDSKHTTYAAEGRLWAIAGMPSTIAVFDGLTREEADVVCAALRNLYGGMTT